MKCQIGKQYRKTLFNKSKGVTKNNIWKGQDQQLYQVHESARIGRNPAYSKSNQKS